MARLNLNFACGGYDLLRPLWEKVVEPAGIDLNVMTMASPERHGRMLRHEEFDACELSLVGYLVAHDQGRDFTAIPAFPHRRFRHSYMVKRTGCGIDKPSDLNGKRIGLDTLQNSAGLWMRGILQDYYGLDLATVEWWCQEEEDVPLEPAAWMKIHPGARGPEHRRDAMRGRSRRVALSRGAAVHPGGLGQGGAALPGSEAGRGGVLRQERHLSHHAHGGHQGRDPGACPVGGGESSSGASAVQGSLLRAHARSPEPCPGLGQGGASGPACDFRTRRLALQPGGQPARRSRRRCATSSSRG